MKDVAFNAGRNFMGLAAGYYTARSIKMCNDYFELSFIAAIKL